MATQRFINNFSTTLSQTFGAADTTLNLTSVAGLPALSNGDWFLLTLYRVSGVQESGHEVVKVTSLVGNALTVQRSFEGAAASQFIIAGTEVQARNTAKSLEAKADVTALNTVATTAASGVSKGDAAQATANTANTKADSALSALAGKQNTLGYTPVQQGGGTSMGGNKVILGWSTDATGILIQVDATPQGYMALESRANIFYPIQRFKQPIQTGISGTDRIKHYNDAFTAHYSTWGADANWAFAALNSASTAWVFYVNHDGDASVTRDLYATRNVIGVSGVFSGNITAGGSITASGNITSTSDESVKENWKDVPANFIARLAKVKCGIYNRKDQNGAVQGGVGANSLKRVAPWGVETNKKTKLKSVVYGNVALVASVELSKKVVSLEKEVADLKKAIAKLLKG